MPVIVIYSSTQACPSVLNVALDMQAKGHELRALSRLPRPRPCRVAALRLEFFALLQDERTLRWTLSQYTQGLRLPDACREADLQADLDMTLWRLEAVTTKLNEVGGLSHD